MLSFFLKKILGRTLLLPVIWSSAYPSIGGDVIIKDIRFEAEDMRVKVSHSRIDPSWGTIFDDRIKVEDAKLRGAVVALSLDNPLSLIKCLELAVCIPKGQLQPKIKGLLPTTSSLKRAQLRNSEVSESRNSKKPKPLELDFSSMSLKESVILLLRGQQGIALDVVSLSGKKIGIPLRGQDIKLKADVYLREILPNEFRGEVWEPDYKAPLTDDVARYPVRMEIDWDAQSRVLKARLLLREIPLKLLSAAFPKQFSSSGTLSGQILLEFDHEKGAWRTPDGSLTKFPELLQ
jgi:hypothetical protein